MKYCSTRSTKENRDLLTFRQVLFAPGYAEDGGLYVPERIPHLTAEQMRAWKKLNYPSLVGQVLRLFVSDSELTDADIAGIIQDAFHNFDAPEIIPLKQVDQNLIIAELFHGPTLAFKDLSMAILSRLLEFFLSKEDQGRVKILVGTSGDTGAAAAYSVSGLKKVDMIMLYPMGRVSDVQELQMTTISSSNVHVYPVDGSSDDLDIPIKLCFQDAALASQNRLGSFNSLQWGRVLLQTAHYIYIYLQSCQDIDQTVTMVVPTGAAGNLAAGFLTHLIGFPIRLVATVNVNDFLSRSLQGGNASAADQVTVTLAPSMDIQAPYNIERLLYLATQGDGCSVRQMMTEYEQRGKMTIRTRVLDALRQVITESVSVDDRLISETMKKCMEQYQYIICPHTATAVAYYFSSGGAEKMVCLATASAAKFPQACAAAGFGAPSHPRLESLKSNPRNIKGTFQRGEDWTAKLKSIIQSI